MAEAVIDNISYKMGESSYRDKLCCFISMRVVNISYMEDKEIIIDFEGPCSVFLSLDSSNQKILTPEIATFKDSGNNFYVL